MFSDLITFEEIMKMKNSYDTTTEFISFLTQGKSVFQILSQNRENRYFTRSITFSYENEVIMTAYCKLEKEVLPKNFLESWISTHEPLGKFALKNHQFSRTKLFENLVEGHLTCLVQLYLDGKRIGICWEIFEIQNVLKMYKMLNGVSKCS